MRPIVNTASRTMPPARLLLVCFLVIVQCQAVAAGRAARAFSPAGGSTAVETGMRPMAAGSDSIYCGARLLERDKDYAINPQTGRISFTAPPDCDSLVVICFLLPEWMTAPAGNPVPPGKRLLRIEPGQDVRPIPGSTTPQKITLSGNKSFSFSVGRAGDGRFSQGLNLDFDAQMADDLRLRGSISDRIGSGNDLVSGAGGTTVLSELDKYFFEIEGRRVTGRGGDIGTTVSRYLPAKRIKGVSAGYSGVALGVAADLGRPAGRYVSHELSGVDGRQGPYQAVGNDGLPTGVVPGSEKVYVDGRLLEGGADKHYVIDYPSGRITFSPRVLITSRSRIEIDFEASGGDYLQSIYDATSEARPWGGKLTISAGGRRESDDRDQLRFGELSPEQIQILEQAGDSASSAVTSGATPDTSGSYTLMTDSSGRQYFQYAGAGAGDYSVSFSYVGEGKGDYRYLGDGVYEFAGAGQGAYLPIRRLPLPGSNDFFFASVGVNPYRGGTWLIEYQGNQRDRNLFSPLDDGDNLRSLIAGSVTHAADNMTAHAEMRYRQGDYDPANRIERPDFRRQWALPEGKERGDEFRLTSANAWKGTHNRLAADFGYLAYKDNLRSYRMEMSAGLFDDKRFSPRGEYRLGNSERVDTFGADGLYERYAAGLSIKAIRAARLELGAERELTKDRYGALPSLQKYVLYRTALFVRNSVLAFSRRIEYESHRLRFKGPQQDKVELTSEESVGRFQTTLAGTWVNQKRLDSDRDDYIEWLYQASFRYAPPSAWMTVQADYRQNQQSARSFGYRFIRVGSGEGDYRFEDGGYLPDPDGDYVRIREERGDPASVSIGEKSHNVVIYPGRIPALKEYQGVLSQVACRLRTEVYEEQSGRDRRRVSWLLPWASRSGVEYNIRRRREGYTLLLFPAYNFYVINLTYGNAFEEQESGAMLFRAAKEYKTELKNQLSPVVRSSVEWNHRRTKESGIGVSAMRLIANAYAASLTVTPASFQVTPRVEYVRFTESLFGGKGSGIIASGETIWRRPNRGEVRGTVEFRSLTQESRFRQPEYLITEGRRFGKSGLINLVINYDVGGSWRLTVNLTDQIHESRPAEFVGRGELVARF